jgi:hypothetical protein
MSDGAIPEGYRELGREDLPVATGAKTHLKFEPPEGAVRHVLVYGHGQPARVRLVFADRVEVRAIMASATDLKPGRLLRRTKL